MLALAGCGDRGKAAGNEDMKRPPALLQFEGYVYVPTDTSDFKILERVRAQTRSVFTGLRRSRVMVSRREVQGATTDSFLKEAVTVVDAAGQRNLALRVRYRFVARPEVANGIDDRKELALAVLHREDDAVAERVLRECTANQDARKGGASAVGLDFDPSLPGCKAAIDAEQAAIDAARAKVPELAGAPASVKDTVVPAEEVRRVYLPTRVTVELRARRPGEVAPRYAPVDRPDEPEQDARVATAEPRGGEGSEALEPAAVIVDPDLATRRTPEEQALAAEGALLPKLPGAVGTSVEMGGRRLPEVVAPATVQAQQRKVEPTNERFEIPLETLADPKFIVVWLSLLMAYPILRGDPRKRR
ncbi:hypothetical protein BE18_27730 [Sorangium cellulosum]|uniref:Uncharacterized protein n=1 Tax=Sorangium cellulosum TaxID=56 RepID=A0A150SWY5_SORCE|nr:hypothetical protein BE18_27730 [Sorangium cellulosum]